MWRKACVGRFWVGGCGTTRGEIARCCFIFTSDDLVRQERSFFARGGKMNITQDELTLTTYLFLIVGGVFTLLGALVVYFNKGTKSKGK